MAEVRVEIVRSNPDGSLHSRVEVTDDSIRSDKSLRDQVTEAVEAAFFGVEDGLKVKVENG